MNHLKTVLNIANKQTNFGFGLVALLTAGGEQIFSSVVFQCPCSELNFPYGMVFLLVPTLALLLLGYILNKKTWKLFTGLCRSKALSCRCRRLVAPFTTLVHITSTALVAPCSWIGVALLNGNYYECAMSGTNVSAFNRRVCAGKTCPQEMHRLPCQRDNKLSAEVLLNLRAQSQILGWLLIASIMLSHLLLTCFARCTSPISYLKLKFWKAYASEESSLIDSYTTQHARKLAERNLKSFFNKTSPENIITPSNEEWEQISALYKFHSRDQCYSTLHRYVENYKETCEETCEETDCNKVLRMTSIRSDEQENPHVLQFVDSGPVL